MKGVEWDDEENVKLAAIPYLGEYLNKTKDPECLKLLLDLFHRQESLNTLRCLAYDHIAIAIGESARVKGIRKKDFPKHIDQFVIDKASEILKLTQ